VAECRSFHTDVTFPSVHSPHPSIHTLTSSLSSVAAVTSFHLSSNSRSSFVSAFPWLSSSPWSQAKSFHFVSWQIPCCYLYVCCSRVSISWVLTAVSIIATNCQGPTTFSICNASFYGCVYTSATRHNSTHSTSRSPTPTDHYNKLTKLAGRAASRQTAKFKKKRLKPNFITLASSELAPNMFGASSELVRS